MPRVPTSEDVPQVGLQQTRDIISVPENAAIDARSRFATAAQEVVGRIADQQNEAALNLADTEAAAQLAGIQEKYANDDDWQTAPARARAEAEAFLQARGGQLRGQAAQQMWTARSADRLAQFDVRVRAQARERGAQIAVGDVIRLGDRAEELAGDLSQPEDVRRSAAENYVIAVAGLEDRGFVTPDRAAELETRFAERVRARVQQGLEGEFYTRLQRDPDELAGEIEGGEDQWGTMPADWRARAVRDAREQGARLAVSEALLHTVQTGELIPETDDRLAGRWAHLGPEARLQYAEHAASARATYEAARALGDTTGLSLPELAARADTARSSVDGRAARAHIRAIQADPVGYLIQTNPAVDQAYRRLQQAIVARDAPGATDEARLAATLAHRQYGELLLRAQEAIGVPSGDRRLYSPQLLDQWAARVRARGDQVTADTVAQLQSRLLTQWGSQDLRDRAFLEHLEALDRAATRPDLAPPPSPADQPAGAVQGANYDTVRGQLLALRRAGMPVDAAPFQMLMGRLAPADRQRLMDDQDLFPAE